MWPRVKRIAVVAAVLGVAGYFAWRYWDLSNRRAQARSARETAAQLDVQLDRVMSLEVKDVPLRKVLAQLAKEHGVTIDVDAAALANVGIVRDPPVTIAMRDVTLREGLRRIADSFAEPLVAVPRSGRVLVTTPIEAEDDVVLEVYPLPPHISGATGVTEEQFGRIVAGVFGADDFYPSLVSSVNRLANQGTTGALNRMARPTISPSLASTQSTGTVFIEVVPGGLVVVHTPESHREIGRLLAAIETCEIDQERLEPLELNPPSAEEQRILRLLEQPVDLDVTYELTADLVGVIRDLAAKYNVPIQIDEEIPVAPRGAMYPKSIQLGGVSLRVLFRRLARELGAAFEVRDDAVRFFDSSFDEGHERLLTLYPCSDLLAPRGGYACKQIAELIKWTISPTAWVDVGGECSAFECGHSLAIYADAETHREVQVLLLILRRHAAGEEELLPIPPSRQRLEDALEKTASVDFVDTPFGEVIQQLSREHGVPIALDRQALDTAGVTDSTTVSFHSRGRPMGAMLADLLRQLELTWKIYNDELILITTVEECEQELRTIVYDVRHLVSPDFREPDYDGLIEIITSIISPTTWTDVGGTGAIVEGDGCLVISQTDRDHREIRLLLDGLTQLFDEPERTAPLQLVSLAPALDAAINAKLDQIVTLERDDYTLDEFARCLEEEFEVPTYCDMVAVETRGYTMDSALECNAKKVSLRSVIELSLSPLECTFDVRDGVLSITIPEEVEQELHTHLYPVADLVRRADENPQYDEVIELLTSVCEPTTWTDVGGVGAIQEYDSPFSQVIAISQTADAHAEMKRLLGNLRHERDPARFPAPKRSQAEQRIEKVLNAPTDLVFKETPLEDVAKGLSDQWGVPIVVDASQEGDPYLITCEVRGLPGRGALLAAVESFGLDVAIDGESILIADVADSSRYRGDTRIYHWGAKQNGCPLAPDVDEMLQLLSSLVDPPSWQDYDSNGVGVVDDFNDLIVVRQRLTVQPDVARYFEFLKSSSALDLPIGPFTGALNDAHRDWVVAQLGGDVHDFATRYAVHVAGEAKAHQAQFVPALVALLQRLDPVRDAALHELVAIALSKHGKQAAGAVGPLGRQLDSILGKGRRSRYVALLAAIGPESVPKLMELVINDPGPRSAAADALMAFGEEARGEVPTLVRAIVENKFGWYWQVSNGERREMVIFSGSKHSITELLNTIDPGFVETRRYLNELKSGDDDGIALRAVRLLEVIDDVPDETEPISPPGN
jgi:hypothetical protein